MVDTPEIRANKATALTVVGLDTSAINVNKLSALTVFNFPTEFIETNQFVSQVVFRATNEMHVNKVVSFVVCRGLLARPALSPWTFTLDGHIYLAINTYLETLIYDFTAQRWYVWGSGDSPMWNPQIGQNWNANIGRIQSDLGGQSVSNVICGDGTTSALYFLDTELDEDYSPLGVSGQPFLRVITGQLISRSTNYTQLASVEVTASDGQNVVASDMTVSLEFSDDTGVTYNSFGSRTVVVGDYSPVLEWRSLGSFRSPGRLLRLIDHGAVRRVDDWTSPANG